MQCWDILACVVFLYNLLLSQEDSERFSARWYSYVQRREKGLRKAAGLPVPVKGKKDEELTGLKENDGNKWRQIGHSKPIPLGKMATHKTKRGCDNNNE